MRVLVISGELSGDLYASLLVKRVREINPGLHFVGIGGPRLRSLDIDIFFNAENLSLVGIPDLTQVKKYLFVMKKVKDLLQKRLVDVVLLVDFPGFNLRVAKIAKEFGYPVVYFVAPQVWAWYRRRIGLLKKYVDLLYVILPFEVEFFKKYEIKVKYFGHPLLEIVKPNLPSSLFFEIYQLNPQVPLISFFPGSRENEVARHIPVFLDLFNALQRKIPNLQGIMVKALGLKESPLWEEARKYLKVFENNQYDVLKNSDLAVLASGTITLEAGLLGTPALVVYSLPSIAYQIAKLLVKVPFISLPNLILQKPVYPEVIIEREGKEALLKTLEELLHNLERKEEIRNSLQTLPKLLGPQGASWRIAEDFVYFLELYKQQKRWLTT